jgi:large subunit ribosomal protein L30
MSPASKNAPAKRIRVKLVRGWAGKSLVQVRNLRALGLRRSGDVSELPDTPDVRGKIDVVQHLVDVQNAI